MRLVSRQQLDQPGKGTSTQTIVIVLVVVISVLVFCIVFFIWYFNRRAKQLQREHGYTKRKSWRASIQSFASVFSVIHPAHVRPDVRDSTYSVASSHRMEHVEGGAGIDRNTSIRSIMTLPAYSAVPRENEGVLGVEGERAGMDTVVEYPEADEDEEERRDAEMESLYQIRLARRREAEARQERRRLRREARERGDFETLANLRHESRRAAREREQNGSEALILEHELRPRSRRVSAVSYGDLGVARHDGSRVRAGSFESDQPLLDASGAFGMSGPIRPWVSRESLGSHRRGSSSFTNVSMTSYGSDDNSAWSDADSDADNNTLQGSRSRTRSRSRPRSSTRTLSRPRSTNALGAPSLAGSRANSRGRHLSLNTDLATAAHLPEADPPPYTSPVNQRRASAPLTMMIPQAPPPAARPVSEAPSLPAIERLPSIHITAGTPIDREPMRRPSFPNFSMRRDSWSPPDNGR